MNLRKYLSLLIVSLFSITVSPIFAQTASEIEAAKELARKYGYSESEISTLLNQQSSVTGSTVQTGVQQMGRMSIDTLSVRSLGMKLVPLDFEERYSSYIEDSLQSLIYGHDLFRKAELNFVPSYNIPTPSNYRFAAGDQVIITIYGASNEIINQVISPEGSITVNNLGPVYLTGKNLTQAENYLKEQLAKNYSGLLGANPNTFLTLSLGKMRSLTVNVVGDVLRPGTVTLPSLSSITSALYMAGGPTLTGSVREVKLYRNGKLVSTFDTYDYIVNGKYNSNIRLEDNDLIVISPYTNLITISGRVKRDMKYEMKESETVADLLKYAGGFASSARTDNIFISRIKGERRESFTLDIADFDSFKLMDGDSLFVSSNIDFDKNRVTIEGAVWHQGDYAISSEMSRLSDLIRVAEIKEDAYTGSVYIKRLSADLEKIALSLSLEDVINGKDDTELMRLDSIRVFSKTELTFKSEVLIRGEVNNPQHVEFRQGMTLGDAILLAGGFNNAATQAYIELARRNKNENAITASDTISTVFKFNLIENPQDISFPLEHWDIITIRKAPDYKEQQTIGVLGEVVFPGYHTVEKNIVRVSDIIKKTNGFTNDAYMKGATLSRQLSDEEYDRMITALEIAQQKTGDTATVFDIAAEGGRFNIAFDLEEALKNPGSYEDVILRTGDIINIPKMNPTVKISGGVLYSNTVAYNPKWGLKEYVDQAGGYLKTARKGKAYIVYMNGKVATRRGGNFKIEPGCEIVIPQKDKRESRPISVAEVMSIATSTTSVATMVMTLIRMLNNQ